MKDIGGRKFFYLLFITVLAFGLTVFHFATAKEFFDFVLGVSLLFFSANVAEKFVEKKTSE